MPQLHAFKAAFPPLFGIHRQTMTSRIAPAAVNATNDSPPKPSPVPTKPIPGGYGIPFISPIKDRLDYYYFQGPARFFQSRIDKHRSTVFRTNMPPGPFIASDPRAVCLLDAKSFPVLFDTSKVEKRDVFTGTYVPSTSLTGGYRVCSYLDPSEPDHAKLKQIILRLVASRKSHLLPSFRLAYSKLFDDMESQIQSSSSSEFNALNDRYAFDFVGDAFFGSRPSDSLGSAAGPSKAAKWLFLQLHPLMSRVGRLPGVIEDLLLHTFRLPSWLVKSDYEALYSYFSSAAGSVLDDDDKLLGMSRDEVCHNLLFAAIFNTYGGMKVFLPGLLARLAQAGPRLHAMLAHEIRSVVSAEGGEVTLSGLERMELTRSVVYEALRIDPPVQLQWGKAKRDLVVESHDAAYEVKKGEMVFGYQQFATRDERVFDKGGEFVADRFVGEGGKGLLRHVLWSNGPETEGATVGNKQCPGKEVVPLFGVMLLVEFFLRFDSFTADVGTILLGARVTVTSLTAASVLLA